MVPLQEKKKKEKVFYAQKLQALFKDPNSPDLDAGSEPGPEFQETDHVAVPLEEKKNSNGLSQSW
jgi:hypothetical protein